MVEVRQARYFLAVAEELHFGRAAERLGMSQPPLSQAIRQLERELGVELLSRSTRHVALTDAGRVFERESRRLIEAAERARELVTHAARGDYGSLRMGAVSSAFAETLPLIIDRFRRAWPNIELKVREINTLRGREEVLDHSLDVAVVRLSVSDRNLRTTPLRRDRFVIALPEDHPAALSTHGDAIELSAFRDDAWVWVDREPSPEYYDLQMTACRNAGFLPDIRSSASTIHTQQLMIAAGLGVGLVPESLIPPMATRQPLPGAWVHGIRTRAPRDRIELIDLALVARAGAREPAVEQFIACARETVADGAP